MKFSPSNRSNSPKEQATPQVDVMSSALSQIPDDLTIQAGVPPAPIVDKVQEVLGTDILTLEKLEEERILAWIAEIEEIMELCKVERDLGVALCEESALWAEMACPDADLTRIRSDLRRVGARIGALLKRKSQLG